MAQPPCHAPVCVTHAMTLMALHHQDDRGKLTASARDEALETRMAKATHCQMKNSSGQPQTSMGELTTTQRVLSLIASASGQYVVCFPHFSGLHTVAVVRGRQESLALEKERIILTAATLDSEILPR